MSLAHIVRLHGRVAMQAFLDHYDGLDLRSVVATLEPFPVGRCKLVESNRRWIVRFASDGEQLFDVSLEYSPDHGADTIRRWADEITATERRYVVAIERRPPPWENPPS